MQFKEAAVRTADMIKGGGLIVSADYSQVSPKCFSQLEQMNRLGFITLDSQEGMQNERAYVCGFMQPGRAERFVESVNTSSDMVALILRPAAKYVPNTSIIVTRSKGSQKTKIPLINSRSDIANLQKDAGISAGARVVLVDCFDPKWERKAYSRDGLFCQVLAALYS